MSYALEILAAVQVALLVSIAIAWRVNRSRFAEIERQINWIDASLVTLKDCAGDEIQRSAERRLPLMSHFTVSVREADVGSGCGTEIVLRLGADGCSQNDPLKRESTVFSRNED